MIRPFRTIKSLRRLKRYRQVVLTLAKYGFGDLASRVGFPKVRARFKAADPAIPTARRLTMALSDLGPTFVKFGQILSTRPDILPERYISELSRLQDHVPPFPLEQVRQIFADELGALPEEVFAHFEHEPVASGSIAQVHRAFLSDGTPVAVKVQRPRISRTIETDLVILDDLARLLERHVPELRIFRLRQLVQEFGRTIRRELDFIAEGQVVERFRKNYEGDSTRFVPRVYWDYSAGRVLTTDFVTGVKVSDLEEIRRQGLDPRAIARNGARAILKEVFEHQLFHADPHPGNFFVLEDNAIASIDYGIVGHLDDDTADLLGRLLTSAVTRNVVEIVRAFDDLGMLPAKVDEKLLRIDIQDFIDRYYGLPLAKLDAEKVIPEVLHVVRHHRVVLPIELALLVRMMMVAAGVGRHLDPEFDILAEARPFVKSFLARRMDPRRTVAKLGRTLGDYQRLLQVLPRDSEAILGWLKKGRIPMHFQLEGLARLLREIDQASNRLTVGLIIAALIVGSSVVMQLSRGLVFGFPILGLIGYLIAGILGLWLVIAILRSGRI